MLRILGGILMVAAGIGLGLERIRSLRNHVSSMEEIRRILLLLQSEISYAKVPFTYAFKKIGRKCKEPYRTWLHTMWENLKEQEGARMRSIWEEAVESCLPPSGLHKKEMEKLQSLGADLGLLDGQMQQQVLAVFLQDWQEELEKKKKILAEQSRICFWVGCMGSLMLLLLLW